MSRILALLLALLLSVAPAIADETIDQLGSSGALTGSESVPIFQTANPAVKTTTQAIANLAVTSIATGCQATGGTITTTGTISTKWQTSPNAPVVTTPYAIASTDACFSLLLNSGASSLTLAAASSFSGTPYWQINNASGGSVTLTITTSTLDGASSVTISNGSQIEFYSDGTNYHYVASSSGSSTITAGTTVTSGITTGDIISSTTNKVADSGIAVSNVPLLNGNNALTGNESHSGTEAFTTTTQGTLAAGSLFLGGTVGTPSNPGANAEGQAYLSTTNGLVLQGQGSTNDFTLLNKAGSTACSVATNGTTWTCGFVTGTSLTATATGNGYNHNISVNGTATDNFENSNNNTSARYQLQFQNSNATNLQGSITLNGGSFSGGDGASAFIVDGVTKLVLQGANTDSMSFGASGAATIYNQPTTGTITYAVCAAANANGSTGGALILDTSATVCGLSGMQFKENIAAFDLLGQTRLASLATDTKELAPSPITIDPSAEIMRLTPGQWNYSKPADVSDPPDHYATQLGLLAQDVCDVDERLCVRDQDGTPRNYRDRGILALLVATVQRQQKEIDALTQQLRVRRADAR